MFCLTITHLIKKHLSLSFFTFSINRPKHFVSVRISLDSNEFLWSEDIFSKMFFSCQHHYTFILCLLYIYVTSYGGTYLLCPYFCPFSLLVLFPFIIFSVFTSHHEAAFFTLIIIISQYNLGKFLLLC